MFQDEADYYYFCLFRDKTSIELSAGFEPTLWNRLVLQACDSPSILQLTIATAALSKAQEQDLWEVERSSHHQYALQQYGKALKGIQTMVSEGQDSMRMALIAALLIFCFESLLGDTFRAVTPIQSSLELIFKRLSTMSRPYRNSRTKPHSTPVPTPIDEELLWAFMRLDGPSLTLLSSKDTTPSPPVNRIFSLAFHSDDFYIPSGFATISEARIYLEDIKWRVLPDTKSAFPDPPEGSSPPSLDKMRSRLKHWYSSPMTASSTSLDSQFAQWHHAFEPLLEYSMTPAGESTFIAAATLHIQALSNDMVISGFGWNTAGRSMSSYMCATTIVALSRKVVEHPCFVKGFVFDIGIIPALVIILMLCPSREVKIETVGILRDMMPRREGVWDSRIVAEAGERMLWEEDVIMDDLICPMLRSESPKGGITPTLRQFLGA
jgi:hypothetical protein